MQLSQDEVALLRVEIGTAQDALSVAHEVDDPLEALAGLTVALDTLTATQHELVNVLLDRGATWATIAAALSTSGTVAERRFPRRNSRTTSAQA